MQKIIEPIAPTSVETIADIEQTQVVLNLSLSYQSLVEKEEILEDFRQAWHEAVTGQTIPISQLWEEMSNV